MTTSAVFTGPGRAVTNTLAAASFPCLERELRPRVEEVEVDLIMNSFCPQLAPRLVPSL